MDFGNKGSNSKELAHWMHAEMQNNNKQAQCTIPWLLLSVTAKMKVKEDFGTDPDTGPNLSSDLQSESDVHSGQIRILSYSC